MVSKLKYLLQKTVGSSKAKILLIVLIEPEYIERIIHYGLPNTKTIKYLLNDDLVSNYLYNEWMRLKKNNDPNLWSGLIYFTDGKQEVVRYLSKDEVDFDEGITDEQEDALLAEFFPGMELEKISLDDL